MRYLIITLNGATLGTLLILTWRASAWKTSIEFRLKELEQAVTNKIKRRWF